MKKSKHLFKLLVPKLNAKLSAVASVVKVRDGFETCRRICRDMDPASGNSCVSMPLDIQALAIVRCRNLEETEAFVLMLDRKAEEYLSEVGEAPGEESLIRVFWEGRDDKTMDDADHAGIDHAEAAYQQVCNFIRVNAQTKRVRSNVRKSHAGARPMDIGNAGGGEGGGEGDGHSEDDDLNAVGIAKGPGRGSRKGKGKGSGELECYTCDGRDHPSLIWTSRKGDTPICGPRGATATRRHRAQKNNPKPQTTQRDGGRGDGGQRGRQQQPLQQQQGQHLRGNGAQRSGVNSVEDETRQYSLMINGQTQQSEQRQQPASHNSVTHLGDTYLRRLCTLRQGEGIDEEATGPYGNWRSIWYHCNRYGD